MDKPLIYFLIEKMDWALVEPQLVRTPDHTDCVRMVLSLVSLCKQQKHMETSTHHSTCSLSIAVAFANAEVPLRLVTLLWLVCLSGLSAGL